VRQDLQQLIVSTASFPARNNIRVLGVGDVVVLRGTVPTEHERKVTEAIIRMTPGVLTVRNELVVQPSGP